MPTPTLQGAEVLLRPLQEKDAEALAAAGSESRTHYGYTGVPDTTEAAGAAIAAAFAQAETGYRMPFAIEWRGRVVGTTSFCDIQHWQWPPGHPLQRTDDPDVVEIGYTWLASSAQRTGCNTEAKLLLMSYAFEHWKVLRVSLRTDARNQRCRTAILRLGVAFDGVRRAEKPASDGRVRDSAHFSIIADEWPAAKAALQARLPV